MKFYQNGTFYQNTLFDTIKEIQRPLPEQRKFEIAYYDLLTSMPEITNRAYEITNEARKRKRPLSIGRSWFANDFNGNVLDLIAQKFPHLIKNTGRGSYCLYLDYKYECYVKKLNKKLFPLYNHTNTSKRLTNQVALKSEEALPVIYIGWTIDKSNEVITGYYAVCIKGKERVWFSDLTSIVSAEEINTEIDKNTEKSTGVVVTVKRNRKTKTS